MKIKEIKKRFKKKCSICGRDVRVISYSDRTYRGGHFFGKIPVCSDKEWKKAIAAGSHEYKDLGYTFRVMNKDPKPYTHYEYWECPGCYWGSR